jgi:hypothetical protein
MELRRLRAPSVSSVKYKNEERKKANLILMFLKDVVTHVNIY